MKKILIIVLMSLAFTTQSQAQEESKTKEYVTAGLIGATIALGAVYIYNNKDELVEDGKKLLEKSKNMFQKVPTTKK